MSQFAAGAVDVQVPAGGGGLVTCYEGHATTLMASAGGQFQWPDAAGTPVTHNIAGGKAAAMLNAENIAFFCMEFLPCPPPQQA
jgi:hypothetical protein